MSVIEKTAGLTPGPAIVARPEGATGVLVLADGTRFWGQGVGAPVVIQAATPKLTSRSSTYPAVCRPTISRHGDGSSAITA